MRGFLVLNATDLLQDPGSWRLLKRALYAGRKLTSSDSGEQEIQIMNDTLHGRLNTAGVPEGWINEHVYYTHGYGVVAAAGSTVTVRLFT